MHRLIRRLGPKIVVILTAVGALIGLLYTFFTS
jgi:hypothetical protein